MINKKVKIKIVAVLLRVTEEEDSQRKRDTPENDTITDLSYI